MTLTDLRVLIRGGGEMASGIAHRLHQCHMRILITETEAPTAVRRTVAFAEAVYNGNQMVEGSRGPRPWIAAGWHPGPSGGLKAGDIDPRTERGYCYLISDKARAVGGGVLEAILHSMNFPTAS